MEMENNLPKGWVECSIGEILTAKKGKKPASTIDEPREGYVPYILIDEMEGKQIRTYTNDPKVSIIDETEVLLVWDGSIGKCGSGLKGAIGSTLVGLKALGGIQTKFLEYTIRQQNNFIKETSTGTGLQHINKDFFEICKIPLPPLAEQHRIVAKLDALFEKIESNKQRLEKIPKLLKRFRQSVLAAAVSGKLTEEWRVVNKNSVDDLIKKVNIIREEKYKAELETAKKLKLRKPKRPSNLVIEVILNGDFSIPDEWRLITLESSASIEHYAMSSGPFGSALGTKDYKETGVKVIRGQNIQNGTFIENNFVFISEVKANELKRSSVKEGDLIVVAVGSSGQVALVPKSMTGSIMSQNCNKMTFDEFLIESKYVLMYLQNSMAISQLKDKTTDTARPFLSLTNLKSVIIPLASIEEQKEIVRRVEQLFAFADKIEARYTKAKAMLDKLPQSILAKAFRGELVAQDPNDEPASVLLERIKAEKEKLAAEKKLIRQAQGKGKKTKEYSIEEKSVKIAAEKKINYKNKKK
ncbi:MAG: Type-1 restriction enzyme EcoKI specificity protein [Bacteroidetes bacterium ADurb.BinA395]|jgi:type I restriction enzyme S subunit|nr:MAG: Type-1 restriction enzyme EcoKI specificity protein [Bacteroidetes bacterium ADurb.BinA395]